MSVTTWNRRAFFVIGIVIGVLLVLAWPHASHSSDDLRFLKAREGSVIDIPSKRLQCTLSKVAFRCVETGKFPQLTVFITKEQLTVLRSTWSGSQMDVLLLQDRGK